MGFNLAEFMSDKSMNLSQKKTETVMLPVSKLIPAGDNFYSKDEERIRKLAATIEVLATDEQSGVQDNLVVKKLDGSDKYEILAGETRWSAVNLLLKEGRIKSDLVPCRIEESGDAVREELILIFTNSTQRIRSDAEKMHEIERLRELLTEYKKSHSLGGTMQQAIAEILSVSKSKVGTLEHISRKLIKPLMKLYEERKIPTSVANQIAGFDEEKQKSLSNYIGYTKTDYVTGDLVGGFDISYSHREESDSEETEDETETEAEDTITFRMDMPEKSEPDDIAKDKPDAEITWTKQNAGDSGEEERISFRLELPEKEPHSESASGGGVQKLHSSEVRTNMENAVREFSDSYDGKQSILAMIDEQIGDFEEYISTELRCIKKKAEEEGSVPDMEFIKSSKNSFDRLCRWRTLCMALSEFRTKVQDSLAYARTE